MHKNGVETLELGSGFPKAGRGGVKCRGVPMQLGGFVRNNETPSGGQILVGIGAIKEE